MEAVLTFIGDGMRRFWWLQHDDPFDAYSMGPYRLLQKKRENSCETEDFVETQSLQAAYDTWI